VTSDPYPARNPLGSVRPSSARALLLVMIGEFVWPAGQPAWSSTLLSGLSEFDIEPNAARKALHRIAATGITTSRREGNRVRWSVTPKGDGILRAGVGTDLWLARPRHAMGRPLAGALGHRAGEPA
jgi:phenylacetic acid degradation operon negative regulatory protein